MLPASFDHEGVLVLNCPLCQFLTRQMSQLFIHCHQMHSERMDIVLYQCSECMIKCTHKGFLLEHISLDHREIQDTVVMEISHLTMNALSALPMMRYRCQLCPFMCAYAEGVSAHYLSRHGVHNVVMHGPMEQVRTPRNLIDFSSVPIVDDGLSPSRASSMTRPSSSSVSIPPTYCRVLPVKEEPAIDLDSIADLVEPSMSSRGSGELPVINNVFSYGTIKLAPGEEAPLNVKIPTKQSSGKTSSPRPMPVSKSKSSSKTSKLLRELKNISAEYKCPRCKREYYRLSDLSRHCRHVHHFNNSQMNRLKLDHVCKRNLASQRISKKTKIRLKITGKKSSPVYSDSCVKQASVIVTPLSDISTKEFALEEKVEEETESSYKCCMCPKRFDQRKARKRHERRIHNMWDTEDGPKCAICCVVFRGVESLKSHVCIKKGASESGTLSSIDVAINDAVDAVDAVNYCSICNRGFQSSKSFRTHNFHFHKKFYLSQRAEEKLRDKKSLAIRNKEKIVTSANNIVEKDTPGSPSIRKVAHARIRSCPKCSVSLAGGESALGHHMSTVHGAPVFRCPLCSLSFMSHAAWVRHQASDHPDIHQLMSAAVCNEESPSKRLRTQRSSGAGSVVMDDVTDTLSIATKEEDAPGVDMLVPGRDGVKKEEEDSPYSMPAFVDEEVDLDVVTSLQDQAQETQNIIKSELKAD